MEQIKTFKVEGAELIYRNFRGEKGMFNQNGDRTFNVILDDKAAEAMAKDGWAVKFPESGDDDEETRKRPHIKVKVGYKIRPPKIVVRTSTAKTELTQETVGMLDWADLLNVDLIAQASHWEVGGKTGIAAYLKTMFVTIYEDELELKYAAIDEEMRE